MRIYTKEELEADLKQLEIENDMMTSSERERNKKYYDRQKQFLTDSLIDLETGPLKRSARRAIEPYKNRMK